MNKLSIISKDPNDLYVKEITKAARKRALGVEVVNFEGINDIKQKTSSLGDVIYWRDSSLDIKSERAASYLEFCDKFVINQTIFEKPYVTHKLYQQIAASKIKGINYIPTYRFRDQKQLFQAIKKKILNYPFIIKPNLGARGVNVRLIRSDRDLINFKDYQEYVFQRYIPNHGDWRVLVMGGRVLGVMKRIARKGSILNNVSRGASTKLEKDPEVLTHTIDIATSVAAILNLAFCAVDVIYDDETKKYYFLELNTMPGWLGGFQVATGMNVGKEFVDYCLEMNRRQTEKPFDLISSYYEKSFDYLFNLREKFHYFSRMYLWFKKPKYYKKLKNTYENFIGGNENETRKIFKKFLSKNTLPKNYSKKRSYYYQKYPARKYCNILFRVLFAETIFKKDLRPIVKSLAIDDEMINLYKNLRKDETAIQFLSTHAVNLVYLLNHYFRDDSFSKSQIKLFPTEHLINLADKLDNNKLSRRDEILRLKMYLLTHKIIGESLFYHRKPVDPSNKKILEYLEKLIYSNYFMISLDAKLEFLVCANLCDFHSQLQSIIHEEAENSLSGTGNFLVDKYSNINQYLAKGHLPRLIKAEHRSVLYLMSTSSFKNNHSSKN